MARTAQSTRATKVSAAKRPPGRPPGSKNKAKATAKASTASTRRTATSQQKVAAPKRTAAATRPAMITKDELRAQVEKLERTNATLRTKNREAGRAAKDATARIAALEAQVAKLERAATLKEAPARRRAARNAAVTPKPKPARSTRGRKPRGARDPGDAVPPGVAVLEPEPMDAEAETAFENLEEHLSGGEKGREDEE